MASYGNGWLPTGRLAITQASLPYTVPADTFFMGQIQCFSQVGQEVQINSIFIPNITSRLDQFRLTAGTTIQLSGTFTTATISGVLFTRS